MQHPHPTALPSHASPLPFPRKADGGRKSRLAALAVAAAFAAGASTPPAGRAPGAPGARESFIRSTGNPGPSRGGRGAWDLSNGTHDFDRFAEDVHNNDPASPDETGDTIGSTTGKTVAAVGALLPV